MLVSRYATSRQVVFAPAFLTKMMTASQEAPDTDVNVGSVEESNAPAVYVLPALSSISVPTWPATTEEKNSSAESYAPPAPTS